MSHLPGEDASSSSQGRGRGSVFPRLGQRCSQNLRFAPARPLRPPPAQQPRLSPAFLTSPGRRSCQKPSALQNKAAKLKIPASNSFPSSLGSPLPRMPLILLFPKSLCQQMCQTSNLHFLWEKHSPASTQSLAAGTATAAQHQKPLCASNFLTLTNKCLRAPGAVRVWKARHSACPVHLFNRRWLWR